MVATSHEPAAPTETSRGNMGTETEAPNLAVRGLSLLSPDLPLTSFRAVPCSADKSAKRVGRKATTERINLISFRVDKIVHGLQVCECSGLNWPHRAKGLLLVGDSNSCTTATKRDVT